MKPRAPIKSSFSGTDNPNYGLQDIADAIRYLADILWEIYSDNLKENEIFKNKKMKKYKFLNLEKGKIKSASGNTVWKVGEWQKQEGKIELCENGFHCSKEPYDAFSYVQGEVLAEVEVRGKSDIQKDKEAWSEMRLVKAYKWTKKDSIKLAIFSAKLVLPIFEKYYPHDDRPRKAIEAAIYYLKHPNKKAADAAYAAADTADAAADAAAYAAADAAGAARAAADAAADAAAYAAADAADAARAAADTADAAAYAAAYAARAAAYAADAADAAAYAADAARAALIKKIQKEFKRIVRGLDEI